METNKRGGQLKLFWLFTYFSVLLLCASSCQESTGKTDEVKESASSEVLLAYIDRVNLLKANSEIDLALLTLDTVYLKAENEQSLSFMNYADFERGSLHFYKSNLDSALTYWQNALEVSKKIEEEPNISQLLSNIGTVYFDKGYLKTAIEYFIQARKKMELRGEVNTESYQFTTVNMAVVHIRQEEYDLAKQVLSAVQLGEWPTVDFLFYLNQSIIQFQLGFYDHYTSLIDSARSYRPKINGYYAQMLAQIVLEKSIEQESAPLIRQALLDVKDDLDLKDIDNVINLHHAKTLLETNYTVSNAEIDSLVSVCAAEGKINPRLSLYTFLKTYYKSKENLNEYASAVEQYDFWKQEFAKMNASSNLIDYYSLLEMDNAIFENEQLKSESQIGELKMKNQLYLNYFLVFMVSTIVLIGYLIFLKLQKEKKENERKLSTLSENIQAYQEAERGLKETINTQELRIKEVMANVSKIAILRKQLDDFFRELTDKDNQEISPKRLKLAKFDLNAFFSNYTDLALIATKDQKDELNIENPIFDQLTTKEKNILSLISNNYTSKEIAVLLSRSEKSIEYARRNIRKKLEIVADTSILNYLNSLKVG